ncbi:hypothetical protein [Balneola vulgaris]|jgi:hypothetical protein|uniref:hypothetical protein n=1 Tax=Balneola vulgaris TaxID=287535 RepID=UPI00036DCEC1|nr:hypothetical protein [Balneola vulgaris]
MSFKKKSIRVTLISFLIYGFLVATHEGEYWPFSIYPMFSKAGQPWTRALVRDMANVPEVEIWETTNLDSLKGNPISMRAIGVDQIDYSNFVSKTKNWNSQRISALRTMLGNEDVNSNTWMIYKVKGQLIGSDSVEVKAIPYLYFKRDTTLFNPSLPKTDYFNE